MLEIRSPRVLDGKEHPAVLPMNEDELLGHITVNPKIFGGKPIIRGRRLAGEHVLGMLATGNTMEDILEGFPGYTRRTFQRASPTLGDMSVMSGSSC